MKVVLEVWWCKVTLAINRTEFYTTRKWVIAFWVGVTMSCLPHGHTFNNFSGHTILGYDDDDLVSGLTHLSSFFYFPKISQWVGPGKRPPSWTVLLAVSRWPALLSPNAPHQPQPGDVWWSWNSSTHIVFDHRHLRIIWRSCPIHFSHLSTSDISELL